MQLLLLTADADPDSVVPSLGLLTHIVQVAPPTVSALLTSEPGAELVMVDAPGSTGLRRAVGGTGLEPVTPSLSSWCSPN